jgi:phosphatidylglycerol:prolipoprotein diacylglycerol transferase
LIEISVGPNLFDLGGFVVAWHGIFSFIGVIVAVYLVARWAPLRGIDPDLIYSIALWAVLGGFVGARVVHVIDNWDVYGSNPAQIIAIWQGGIGVWGGILGGFAGGMIYLVIMRVPRPQWGIVMDLTAPALLLAQTIGRLGDFANGEHCAKAADHFLSMTWTHAESLARRCINGHSSSVSSVSAEPVILYEIIWNMLVLSVLWVMRGRLKPNGMIWALYISLYALGRFAISFAREDKIWAAGMQEAHFIALAVLAIGVPLLVYKARLTERVELEPAEAEAPSVRGTRARRRRQKRG